MVSLKSPAIAWLSIAALIVSCGRVATPDEQAQTYQSATRSMTSGPARLVKEISGLGQMDQNFDPTGFVSLGNVVIFSANGGEGHELWKSDGTLEGTVLLRDIWPMLHDSAPALLTEVNGLVYFVASDGPLGRELWKTDGTPAGTVLVKDICAEQCESNPRRLTKVNDTLFFLADDGVHGEELWKSDGTTAGTVLVKDINPGQAGSNCQSLASANGLLFFSTSDPIDGEELWRSDGTEAGTVMVKDIYPGPIGAMSRDRTSTVAESALGPDAPLQHIKGVGDVVFFVADDGMHGPELWKSDGTAAGTTLVKDINRTGRPSFASQFTDVNGVLFFAADDANHGLELWKSDGTEAGTTMVADIVPDGDGSNPVSLTNFDGKVAFLATEPGSGTELWLSDGTSAGTAIVQDLAAGSASSTLTDFTVADHALFFNREVGQSHGEIWKTDGTSSGTHLVKDAPRTLGFPPALIGLNDHLFFQASRQLWALDKSAGLIQLRGAPMESWFYRPMRYSQLDLNGTLFFSTGQFDQNLLVSDGTEAGTATFRIDGGSGNSCLAQVNGVVVFSRYDNITRHLLWRTDGTVAGTFTIEPYLSLSDTSLSFSGRCLDSVLQGSLYFTGRSSTGVYSLWKTDGTTAGTVIVKEISQSGNVELPEEVSRIGNLLFFTQSKMNQKVLWVSDGTPAGTMPIQEINTQTLHTFFRVFAEKDGVAYLYFRADGGQREIWRSDGTRAGTVLVDGNAPLLWADMYDITTDGVGCSDFWWAYGNPGCSGAYWGYFTSPTAVLNGAIYLLADAGAHRLQLRRLDERGTTLIKEFSPFLNGGAWETGLMSINGKLYFTAYDPVFGQELWTSDGTPEGTVLLKDIEAGAMSSEPAGVVRIGDAIAFHAADAHGMELWRSGRTTASTVLVQDIRSGAFPSAPSRFIRHGSEVFFLAVDDNGLLGLFAIPATEIDTPPQIECPDEISVDATDDDGANVSFAATATDIETDVTPTYSQEPGSYFTIGTHTVTATVVDGLGTTVSCSFPVTVRVGITCPADMTVEATSSAGATVSFEALPARLTTTIAYSSEPGSMFPLGTTTVTATATDARGRLGTCSFDVHVVDTTPPAIAVQDITVEAPTPDGVNVAFPGLVVTEAVALASVVATPASGSVFPLGVTPVKVVATDAAGNFSEATFTVTVVLARHKIGAGCGCSSGEAWADALLLLGLGGRMRRGHKRQMTS